MGAMSQYGANDASPGKFFAWVFAILTSLALIVALFGGVLYGFKSFSRSQARKNAENQVLISNIQIRNQKQRIVVAQQKAEIRRQKAIGIREAQDEIAKTLTPLYVQFEMTQVLLEIAKSGRNNSVVYIPSGDAGIPLIQPALP